MGHAQKITTHRHHAAPVPRASNMKAYLALVFICLVWGTTYLAMRIGIAHYPPFLFAALRQTTAGLLLLTVVLLSRMRYPWTAKNIGRQALAGFLMISLGNGLVSWAIQYIPSGLAALIGSLTPACTVFISQVLARDFSTNRYILGGLAAGIVGMGLVFGEHLGDLANPAYLGGVLLTFAATVAWALGTVYSKNFGQQSPPLGNAALQLGFGGLGQLLWSAGTEDWAALPPMRSEVWMALAYLVVFGSVLAFVCYLYVLQHLPIGLASVYAYINPLVAVLLGWWLLSEPMSPTTGLAFLFVVLGVYAINRGYRRPNSA